MTNETPADSQNDESFRIASDGTWFHGGRPIARHGLVKLFSRILRRDEEGAYWLQTPVEKVPIAVDDAPFLAVEIMHEGSGEAQVIRFRTNVDDIVTLEEPGDLRLVEETASGEPRPYIRVRNGLDALVVRSAYYNLAALAVERDENGGRTIGVWSSGRYFPMCRPG